MPASTVYDTVQAATGEDRISPYRSFLMSALQLTFLQYYIAYVHTSTPPSIARLDPIQS